MDALTQPNETIETLKLAAGGGAAVAVLVVVYKFLSFLDKERKGRTVERAAERAEFKASIDKVVDSHSQGLDRILNSNSAALDRMLKAHTDALDRVVESNERSLRDVAEGLVEVKKHTVAVEGKVDELRKEFNVKKAS